MQNTETGKAAKGYIEIDGVTWEVTLQQVSATVSHSLAAGTKLSDVAAGEVVKIGSHEMIVLEQVGGATLLLRRDLLPDTMQFGDSNNYDGSCVDEACNEFAGELAGIVGDDNILPHSVDLTSDDGLKDYGEVQRRASLLTTAQYRRYVQILDKYKPDTWWWLSTPFSTATNDNDTWVKCVSPSGDIYFDDYGNGSGVRPFLILKSSIFVSSNA